MGIGAWVCHGGQAAAPRASGILCGVLGTGWRNGRGRGRVGREGKRGSGGFSFNRKHAGKEQGLEPGALEGQRWESQETASPGPQGWASAELRGGGAGRTGAESEGVPALRAWLILPSPCRAFTRGLAPMRVSCM